MTAFREFCEFLGINCCSQACLWNLQNCSWCQRGVSGTPQLQGSVVLVTLPKPCTRTTDLIGKQIVEEMLSEYKRCSKAVH